MEKKIGILANSERLKKVFEKLYEEDIQNGKIIIDILDSDRINEQGIELEKKGAMAIIARSRGYHHTIGKVNVPVINLKIRTQDILHEIMDAEDYNKKIVLVLSDYEEFDYSEWKRIIRSELIMEVYSTYEEMKDIIIKYKDIHDEVVIIGEGIPCNYAKSLNMNNINITASDETIHEVVSRAREIVDNLFEQKYKNSVLRNILDNVHDAIIAVDKDENVILFNERSEELFKRDINNIINTKLVDNFPELNIISDVLINKKSIVNKIVRIKNVVATANIDLIEVDGQIEGILCTFQDITKLQVLEKKIRYEMNKKGLTAKYKFSDIIAVNSLMRNTLERAVSIGKSDGTAILYGESGTGKEMIAQSIHNISERRGEPFVAVNCAALTESLLESELFGYEEGAFTGARKGGKVGLFELAHGGTIFLDEINSISINLQTKLLRVLEEREVMRIGSDYVIPLNVRIIAASNEDLNNKIKDGSFRSDLFYRLSIFALNIPPLRKRKDDIVPLFKNFLNNYANNSNIPAVDVVLEQKLLNYSWPGNVRELRNAAERYILFGEIAIDEEELSVADENINIELKEAKITTNFSLDLKEIDKYVELKVISMLEKQGMSKNEIAMILGISRSSLWQKIKSGKDMFEK